eukprot:1183658-Rhodomonas_salina.1
MRSQSVSSHSRVRSQSVSAPLHVMSQSVSSRACALSAFAFHTLPPPLPTRARYAMPGTDASGGHWGRDARCKRQRGKRMSGG